MHRVISAIQDKEGDRWTSHLLDTSGDPYFVMLLVDCII
jgi:hypothetical protein